MQNDAFGGYTGPFRSIRRIGDPFMLYDDVTARYYLYCTGGKYQCWSSDTLEHWTAHGDSYLVTEKSFGTVNYWAPEVYKRGDTYYMVYSAARMLGEQKRHSIGIAASKSPTGPFTDLYDRPLFAPDYSVIDASLLFDDDGRVYLYYSRDCSENYVDGKRVSQTCAIEVASDFSATVGEPVLLATPTSPWELLSGNTLWNEGPCVFKRNGVYYLLFTANYYASVHYCVGYATSLSPLGPFIKAAENPIVVGDGVYTSGTGHCNVCPSPDGSELYMVYHSHSDVTNTENPVADRTPCVDKMVFDAEGKLSVNGPFVVKQPYPSGTNGLYQRKGGIALESSFGGDPAFLTDGAIATERVYRFAGKGNIKLTYSDPVSLESLWLYSDKDGNAPKSATLLVNGTQISAAQTFSAEKPYTPAVFSVGCTARTVEILLDGGEGACLSEIITVERK